MRPGAYPTPAQVSVFMGDIWLDDAFRIEVRYQNPQVPLYGYAESEFTAVAQGKRIVQGSLIINFRYPEYLRTAMENIGETKAQNDRAVDFMNRLRTASVADRIGMLEEARMQGVGADIKPIFVEEFAKKMGVANPHWADGPHGETRLGTTLPSTMRIDVNRPLTLKIYFDTPEDAQYHWEIEDVHLVGQAMTISNQAQGGDASASGMPLYEMYSFFAKRVTTVMRSQINWGDERGGSLPDGTPVHDFNVIDASGMFTPEDLRKVR